MLPINLLQSQLAHNKKRINELQNNILIAKANRGFVLRTLEQPCELSCEEELSCKDSVISWNLQIKKIRKQLKQLAILQREIKLTIKTLSYWKSIDDSAQLRELVINIGEIKVCTL